MAEPLQSLFEKTSIDVIEQIVNVLHRDLEILDAQLKGKASVPIETVALWPIPFRRHRCKTQPRSYGSKRKPRSTWIVDLARLAPLELGEEVIDLHCVS